jgi:AraC-like DNA-binding protein
MTIEAQEIVSFRRRSELAGVEVRTLVNSERPWSRYAAEFEFLSPSSWQAEVWHRRREHLVAPGFVLSAHPGEVFAAKRVVVRGAASSLTVDAPVLQEYVAEHGLTVEGLRLRSVTRMSSELQRRLFEVFALVRPGPSSMQVQASLVEFVAALVGELVDDSSQPLSRHNPEARVAAQIREYLHGDPAVTVDLSTLSRDTGMSRFKVLRVFKRRYGLPPHTYQLQRRLVLAQRCLREGMRPAQVAAQYGFVDQSHLTRHFKRLLGVTPAQYARGSARSGPSDPSSLREAAIVRAG